MKNLIFSFIAICGTIFALPGNICAKTTIKALIVTGQNNHNWRTSHIVLQDQLQETGLFAVSSVIAEEGLDNFTDFKNYDVVVLDYNGKLWGKKTRRAFERYVKNGGGVVVYHAADNSFPTWEEFNKITALGGWEGRDEKSGPYVYWQDGRLIKDTSPGKGGSHGAQHEYVLNRRNDTHPIVKGLPQKWPHAKDELYDRMRGPGNIKDLLYTAYSDPAKGGSGREEPLVFTVDYGKARIFHIMIGHSGPEFPVAMECPEFKILFTRGTEWAATGDVTIPVPKDLSPAR